MANKTTGFQKVIGFSPQNFVLDFSKVHWTLIHIVNTRLNARHQPRGTVCKISVGPQCGSDSQVSSIPIILRYRNNWLTPKQFANQPQEKARVLEEPHRHTGTRCGWIGSKFRADAWA